LKINKLLLLSFCLLAIFSCSEEDTPLESTDISLSGTYIVTDVMLYPNSDCSGTPVSGMCASNDSITVQLDCPDSSWVSYIDEFEDWSMALTDSSLATINDGYETENLTYTNDVNTITLTDSDSDTITITLSADNTTLTANLTTDASCFNQEDEVAEYTSEDTCNTAGFEWEEASCIGLTLTLLDDENDESEDSDDETSWLDELPEAPACIEDCANFDVLDGDHSYTNAEVCGFIVQWTDCSSDCEGDDKILVDDVIEECTECLEDDSCDDSGEDEGPPACVEDCPDFDLLTECDDDTCDAANANCLIINAWAGDDCIDDCEGEDMQEVDMVIGVCTECIANGTDCEEALDSVYDEDDNSWLDELPEAPACVEDCTNFDVLDGDHSYTNAEVCGFIVQWTDCSDDCEGDDKILVDDVIEECTECLEDDSCDGPSYTLNDIAGVWDMISIITSISIVSDLSVAVTYLDEEECGDLFGTYSNSTCSVSDATLATIIPPICSDINGSLDGYLCSYTQIDSMYYSYEDYETVTIDSTGSMTIVAVENGEEETTTGNISVNGSSITWTADGAPGLTGTLFITDDSSEVDTATLEFENVDVMDLVMSENVEEEFQNSLSSVSGSVVMVMVRGPWGGHTPTSPSGGW